MLRRIAAGEASGVGGTLVIRRYRAGRLVYQSAPMHNKVVSGASGYGRNLLARQLAGDTTYPIEIDSARLGDSSTAPADSDTDLGNVLVTGITITNKTVANGVVQVDVFLSDANLANGTYREMGFYCNGRLFARILISPEYTKATGEDTLFTYTLTLTG